MSSQFKTNSADSLVRLFVVSPQHLEPTLSKAMTGRLDRVLRDVGSTGGIAVRARMITAVASTKFKTLNGLPVSLVGLHGKDELLVAGPSWALERVSRGDYPESKDGKNQLSSPQRVVENEIILLNQVHDLLQLVRSIPKNELEELNAESKVHHEIYIAMRKLTALFRTKIGTILHFFETNDPLEFVTAMTGEANEVLRAINAQYLDFEAVYPKWWLPWERSDEQGNEKLLITTSGRHVTCYPVAGRTEAEYLARPRQNDLALVIST